MDRAEFNYELPEELIAQQPAERRDESRLMVVDRKSGEVRHSVFSELPSILGPSDLLVLNDTRVFPARIHAEGVGRPAEVLLIRRESEDVWQALVKPGRKARPGERLVFVPGQFEAEVIRSDSSPIRWLQFLYEGDFWGWIERIGKVPVPPYIRRSSEADQSTDRIRYQTVYARERGSVAAPTAGLHFTESILERLEHCFITLHVGYGTFKPVKSNRIEEHRMDPEAYSVSESAALRVNRQICQGERVIAVGTTTTRTLEHLGRETGQVRAGSGLTDLFIYPPFNFQVTSGLITNFHLPGSTLLMLVSAFAGKELIEKCYREAVARQYRFYSYGDAMLIQ